MRIKIIGDNNCARATQHLLRMAGFAVTEFLPAEAITHAPHFGYAITIELAPAHLTPEPASLPDQPTHGPSASVREGTSAVRITSADVSLPASRESRTGFSLSGVGGTQGKGRQAEACPTGGIHFDSVDGALEAAVLRHVTQLAAAPVILDRPGGVVHSERELRIVVPHTRDAKADEAAAVAVEFGVLRGLLDLVMPASPAVLTGEPAAAPGSPATAGRSWTGSGKKWWMFAGALLSGALLAITGGLRAAPRPAASARLHVSEMRGSRGAYLHPVGALSPAPAQGEFATGQQTKITDGTNTLVIDPCKGQTKLYASINQTSNAQLAAGISSKKIYICSIHVVVAAATNVALVEGTGSVCATGTAGVSGFGGATAATGWNFMANGGIALGNGDSSLGAEGTAADNLCLFNSGSGQVSGGISYVVQ